MIRIIAFIMLAVIVTYLGWPALMDWYFGNIEKNRNETS